MTYRVRGLWQVKYLTGSANHCNWLERDVLSISIPENKQVAKINYEDQWDSAIVKKLFQSGQIQWRGMWWVAEAVNDGLWQLHHKVWHTIAHAIKETVHVKKSGARRSMMGRCCIVFPSHLYPYRIGKLEKTSFQLGCSLVGATH